VSELLIISSSPSDFEMLKTLTQEISKKQKVDLLCLFKPNSNDLKSLRNKNINLKIENLNLTYKTENNEFLNKDLIKVNRFISSFLSESKYKLFLILGDRYELLPVAQQIYLNKKILIHLHGGEVTQGSWDDSIRHSISKLSHIHFVSSKKAKENLISMGEQSRNIFNYGSLGASNAKDINILNKESLFKELNLNTESKSCLLVVQPITNSEFNMTKNMNIVVNFLIGNNFNQILISNVNTDPGSKEIINYFKNTKVNDISFRVLDNLGLQKYISLAKYCDLVIGNSSSFIFEFPMKNIKSILITDRQKGRELSEHVFESKINVRSLERTYSQLIKTKTKISSPYFKKNTAEKISHSVNNFLFDPPEFKKAFNYEE